MAGFTGAITVVTTTNYVAALPAALAFWLVLRGRPSVRETVTAAAFVLVGAILCVVLLMDANVLAGGEVAFFWPLIQATLSSTGGRAHLAPLTEWLPRATWLVFPILVTVGGLGVLAIRIPRRSTLSDEHRVFLAAFVGFVLLWGANMALHARAGHFLETHFNYVVVAPAAIALAGVIRCLPRRDAHAGRLPAYAFVAIAVVLTLPQVTLGPTILPGVQAALSALVPPKLLTPPLVVSLVLGVCGLVVMAGGLTWRRMMAASFSVGLAWNFVNPYGALVMTPAACRLEREHFLLVLDAAEWLASRGLHGQPRSWFSLQDAREEPAGCPNSNHTQDYVALEQAAAIWRVSDPLRARIRDYPRDVMKADGEAKRRAFFIILSPPDSAADLDRELVEWAAAHEVYIRPRPARRETFSRGPLSLTVQAYGVGDQAWRLRLEALDSPPDE